MKPDKILIESITAFTTLVFGYTGADKLANLSQFRMSVAKSPYLYPFSGIIVWVIPCLELLIAVGLVLKISRLLALHSAFFLMSLFSWYVYVMLRYSYYLPCSCGGIIAKMSWKEHLVFNIVLTVLIATAILFTDKILRNDRQVAEHL